VLGAQFLADFRCRRLVLMSGVPAWWLLPRMNARPQLVKPFTLRQLAEALGIPA
jgi:hypothetical protein